MNAPRYNRVRRSLHWGVAALVLFTLPLGYVFTDFDNRVWLEATLGTGAFNAGYSLHKSIGLLVVALMAARLAAKWMWPDPPYAAPLDPFSRTASRAAHRALYALLLVTPLLGWAGVSAYPAPLPFFGLGEAPALLGPNRALAEWLLWAHGVVAIGLAAIAAVHIAAALHHGYIRRDGVLDRMRARR